MLTEKEHPSSCLTKPERIMEHQEGLNEAGLVSFCLPMGIVREGGH